MNDRPNRCLLCEARLNNPVCQAPDSVARFSALTTIEHFKPGQTLFAQGDRLRDVFVIRSGQVKLVYEHPDGTAQLLRVAGPGETLGLAVGNGGAVMATASTRGGASVCRARLSEIEALVQADPTFALTWAHLLLDEIRRAREAIFHLGPHPAGVRLARFLLQSAGLSTAGKSPRFSEPGVVNLTHADLAAALSIAHETATRLLRDLEEKNVVRLTRGRIEIIDPDRLLSLGGYPGSAVDVEAGQ